MGWRARVAVIGVTVLFGCTAIANIGDGTPDVDVDAATSPMGSSGTSGTHDSHSSSGTSGTSGSSGARDASMSLDAAKDASPDTSMACTKKQNNAVCATSAECCGACTEDLRCHNSCKDKITDFCNPIDSNECCVGYYCSGVCRPCVLSGNTPEQYQIGGGANPKSCCTKVINSTTKMCQ
jgi:hypothetical protein